jgi:hypothetical protein
MRPLPGRAVEAVFDISWALDRERLNCESGRACGSLSGTKLHVADRGVPEHGHTGKLGHGFLEKLDLLAP